MVRSRLVFLDRGRSVSRRRPSASAVHGDAAGTLGCLADRSPALGAHAGPGYICIEICRPPSKCSARRKHHGRSQLVSRLLAPIDCALCPYRLGRRRSILHRSSARGRPDVPSADDVLRLEVGVGVPRCSVSSIPVCSTMQIEPTESAKQRPISAQRSHSN